MDVVPPPPSPSSAPMCNPNCTLQFGQTGPEYGKNYHIPWWPSPYLGVTCAVGADPAANGACDPKRACEPIDHCSNKGLWFSVENKGDRFVVVQVGERINGRSVVSETYIEPGGKHTFDLDSPQTAPCGSLMLSFAPWINMWRWEDGNEIGDWIPEIIQFGCAPCEDLGYQIPPDRDRPPFRPRSRRRQL